MNPASVYMVTFLPITVGNYFHIWCMWEIFSFVLENLCPISFQPFLGPVTMTWKLRKESNVNKTLQSIFTSNATMLACR